MKRNFKIIILLFLSLLLLLSSCGEYIKMKELDDRYVYYFYYNETDNTNDYYNVDIEKISSLYNKLQENYPDKKIYIYIKEGSCRSSNNFEYIQFTIFKEEGIK